MSYDTDQESPDAGEAEARRARDEPAEPERALDVVAFGMTDVGRTRKANEDQFLIAELSRAMRVQQSSLAQPPTVFGDNRAHLFLVADGMGGHRAGEQASALAVGTIREFLLNTFKWIFRLQGETVLGEFQDALQAADDRIFAEAGRHPEWQGMGTTLTMAYAVSSTLYVIHVGDSRCYLFREGELLQLTQDHTLVQEMVKNGVLAPAEAAQHYMRNIITNAVGGNERGIQVEIHKVALEPGDELLVCSDGLTEMVPDDHIAVTLAENDPESACRALVDAANAAGGRDNITAIVARFDQQPASH